MKFVKTNMVLVCVALCLVNISYSQNYNASTVRDSTTNVFHREIPISQLIDSLAAKMLTDSTAYRFVQSLDKHIFTAEDSLVYFTNPFFIPLINLERNIDINYVQNFDEIFKLRYFPDDYPVFTPKAEFVKNKYFNDVTGVASLQKIRNDAREFISRNAMELYAVNQWDLPDIQELRHHLYVPKTQKGVSISDAPMQALKEQKFKPLPVELLYWQPSLTAMAQFSQNYISSNWYQDGTSNMAALSDIIGGLTYQNFKNVKWTTAAEWRAGFISVADTSARRKVNANEDLFKIDSKFELKAKGNWSYSALLNFSTQFFDNYKSFNSNELKAKLFTPLRLNFGIGMNYGYKKLLSVMLAPVSYKLIYMPDLQFDKRFVNPNLFGIEMGKNQLSEIGSSMTATLVWKPLDEIQIGSTFKFYTNYKKVEIDWETIINFTINKYLSTRLLLNPRYDNTVILASAQKARIQFKELLSFGINYKIQ